MPSFADSCLVPIEDGVQYLVICEDSGNKSILIRTYVPDRDGLWLAFKVCLDFAMDGRHVS